MSSELKTTNIKHADSASNNLVLASDGSATIAKASIDFSSGTITTSSTQKEAIVHGVSNVPVIYYFNVTNASDMDSNGNTWTMANAKNPTKTISKIFVEVRDGGRVTRPSVGSYQASLTLACTVSNGAVVNETEQLNAVRGSSSTDTAWGVRYTYATYTFSTPLTTSDTYTIIVTSSIENNWTRANDYTTGFWVEYT